MCGIESRDFCYLDMPHRLRCGANRCKISLFNVIAGSANGRPMDSESINLGSNPSPAVVQMKIFVKAKPRARKEYIKKIDESHFVVAVKEPAEKGKANATVIKAVADYFKVGQSRVRILSGKTSPRKVVEILSFVRQKTRQLAAAMNGGNER